MPFSITFVVVLGSLGALALPHVTAAQTFLGGPANVMDRDRIVNQLRQLLGHGQKRERLGVIEELLRPTFMAFPKDSSGSLTHPAARSALYRYFVTEHGWQIKGLSLDVEDKHTSSPAEVLKSSMPSVIMGLLEEQIGSARVGLDELTVLVACIEDLVHSDVVDLLEIAYKTHQFSTNEVLDAGQANMLIRTFTLFFVYPDILPLASDRKRIQAYLANEIPHTFLLWNASMLWVQDVVQGLEYQAHSSMRPFVATTGHHFDFLSLVHWATEVSAGFGRFADLECKEMKNGLMALEGNEREDGRVSLGRFYAPFLAGGTFHFTESPMYLRHLGALDEHSSRLPSVIATNVLLSVGNCISTSGLHYVCCINHCEVLMARLEAQVSQEVASPALVAAVVSDMSSETVAAPRNLSATLRLKLDEIAGKHGGSVRLQSRLFAQWMHYAFPYECPFPRSLLTSEAELPHQAWTAKHKSEPFASDEEMLAAVAMEAEAANMTEVPVMLWSDDEEPLSGFAALGLSFSDGLFQLAALGAMMAGAVSACRTDFGKYIKQRAKRAGLESMVVEPKKIYSV